MDQYIVLVFDTETQVWSILHAGPDSDIAYEEYKDACDKTTPALVIFTGQYVTV